MDKVRIRDDENIIVFVNMEAGINVCRLDELWAQESYGTYASDEEYEKVKQENEAKERAKRERTKKQMISSISAHRHNQGPYKVGPFSEWEREQLKYLLDQGISEEKIAEILHRSLRGIRAAKGWIKRPEKMNSSKRQKALYRGVRQCTG